MSAHSIRVALDDYRRAQHEYEYRMRRALSRAASENRTLTVEEACVLDAAATEVQLRLRDVLFA